MKTIFRNTVLIVLGSMLCASAASAKWTNQSWLMSDGSVYLSVSALSATRACAVGLNQTGSNPQPLFVCTSDGSKWNQVTIAATILPTAILLADDQTGFMGALLGGLYRSDDGAATWTKVQGAAVAGPINEFVKSADGKTMLAVGSTKLLISTDSGKTWTQKSFTLPAGDNLGALSVETDGAGTVWVAGGDPGAAPSTDSGTGQTIPGRPASSGFVLVSHDSAATFETLESGLAYCVNDVEFINAKEGWLAGGADAGGAVVAYTEDGGKTWKAVKLPNLPDDERTLPNQTKGDLAVCLKVTFFSRNVGLVLCTTATFEVDGFNGLYLTKDGGKTWTLEPGFKAGYGADSQSILFQASSQAFDMAMPDCSHGWVVGQRLLIHRYDADEKNRDCAAGGSAVPDGGADGGDGGAGESSRRGSGCGCDMAGKTNASLMGSLISTLAMIF